MFGRQEHGKYVFAVRRNSFSAAAGISHHDCTTAPAARRTWHNVTSGFFPPQPLAPDHQEQVADRRQYQVALQTQPRPPLPTSQPDFPFLLLEAALDRPTGKRYPQQVLQRRVRRSITEEVLPLARQRIVAHQQTITFPRQAFLVLESTL